MEWRDRMIPWYFVMFFGVIAAVNAVMVTLAFGTFRGMVTDHPYEKGLAYNSVVHAQEEQDLLGWMGEVTYQNGVISFRLKDKTGALIIPDHTMAEFFRPTQAGKDFSIELSSERTPVSFPMNGLWQVRVTALLGKQSYQMTKRFVVP